MVQQCSVDLSRATLQRLNKITWSKVWLQEQESSVGGAELESINILQRLQGIQLLGKELVMGSNVTPSIHPAGASKRAAKIAPAWKMGHAVRNTAGVQKAAKTGSEAVIVQKVSAEADNAHVLLPVENVIRMFAETAG